MNNDFYNAFTLVMKYEVGEWFNPEDIGTQQGLIETKQQRFACGYNNIEHDKGGETKFGISKNSNPQINIKTLTLEEAQNIYYHKYWILANCDKIDTPLNIIHFDTCVNMGIKSGAKILQTSLGVTVDGNVGQKTLTAITLNKNILNLCLKYLSNRQIRYDNIIKANPNLTKFAKGWSNRISSLNSWLMKQ
jgi:lysozyme family protein